MSLSEIRAKWEARRAEHARLDSHVSAARLIADVLADLEQLERSNALDAVTLAEASAIGGYSVDRLQHLVRSGTIANLGRKGRPRIRRGDVPIKPGYLRPQRDHDQLHERRRIVASVTTGSTPE